MRGVFSAEGFVGAVVLENALDAVERVPDVFFSDV